MPTPPHPPRPRPTITGAIRQPTTSRRAPKPKPKGGGGGDKPKLSLNDRVRNDPALLERALKDPGLRSQLDDRYLTPEQLKVRKNRQFTEDLGDVTTGLTGDSMTNAAQTLTDRDFEPLLQDIGRQEQMTAARTREQQTRAAGYFGGLQAQGNATLAQQANENRAALQAAADRTTGALGMIGQQGQAAEAAAAHDADVRGAGLGGGGLEQMAADRAAAQMRATQEGKQAQDAAAANGAATDAFLRGTQMATAQAGGEVQGQIGARGDNALGELANSRRKLNEDRKGSLVDTTLKLRQNEVDRYLTERGLANDHDKAILDFKQQMASLKTKAQIDRANRDLKLKLTSMGLDAKAAQAEADRATQEAIAAGHDATSSANASLSASTSSANNAATNHQSDVNNRRNNSGKGAGGFTHKDRVDSASKRDDAITLAQQYKARRASRDTALQLLTEKYGSDFARVAVGAIYDGGAKPHLDALLAQRYGIHVPQKFRHR